MKKLIQLLIIIFVGLCIIDFAQTHYWLNKYGFHLEQNPFITNNTLLMLKLTLELWSMTLIIYLTHISDKAQKPLKQTIYCVILMFLTTINIMRIEGVINNFAVMLW